MQFAFKAATFFCGDVAGVASLGGAIGTQDATQSGHEALWSRKMLPYELSPVACSGSRITTLAGKAVAMVAVPHPLLVSSRVVLVYGICALR